MSLTHAASVTGEKTPEKYSTEAKAGVGMPVTPLVFLLTSGTGAVDAFVILAIGDAFASIMTGNLIFLGLGIGTQSGETLSFVLAAFLGYVGGGGAGSYLVKKLYRPTERKVWPPRVTAALGIQLIVLSALSLWWFIAGASFSHLQGLILLICLAAAMGIQGAAIRSVGVTLSTTYLTGALTTLLESVVTRKSFTVTEAAALTALLSLVCGAVAGGLLYTLWSSLALLFPVVTLASAVSICLLVHLRSRRRQRSSRWSTSV